MSRDCFLDNSHNNYNKKVYMYLVTDFLNSLKS